MTPQAILIGIGAGLISAIVFASASTGALPSRVLLLLLTPFPLYLAGLALGFVPVLAGAAAATALVFTFANPEAAPVTALTFAVSEAGPAVLLTRLALLGRGEGETRQWYPVGRIIITAALISGVLALAFLAAQGADTAELVKAIRPAVDEFAKSQMLAFPGATPLTEAQLVEMTSLIVATLPGGIALAIMIGALASLWLAGRVTLASGRLARPWPDFSKLELPIGAAIVLLAATGLSLTSDRMWLMWDGMASAFRLAFTLLGLAVIHHVTRGSPWRGFVLATSYAGLLILTRHALLVLSLIGLAETIFHYRRAGAKDPPAGHS